MRRMIFSLIAAAAAAAGATPAFAQTTAPFTGARVEGIIGWDRVQANGGHDDNLGYGVAGGYDFQYNGLLVGIEGEAADSNARSCYGARSALDPRVCAKAARDLYVGGRVGTVIGGRTLLYAKAGYTNARFKATSDTGATETTLFKTDLDGVRVGAGAEYAIGPNSYLKAEYRYSNYARGLSRNQVIGGFGFRF